MLTRRALLTRLAGWAALAGLPLARLATSPLLAGPGSGLPRPMVFFRAAGHDAFIRSDLVHVALRFHLADGRAVWGHGLSVRGARNSHEMVTGMMATMVRTVRDGGMSRSYWTGMGSLTPPPWVQKAIR